MEVQERLTYTSFNNYPQLIAAALEFKARWSKVRCKARGYANWIEALQMAWYQGWDDREPNGHLLRQFRNQYGHHWLNQQNP